MAKTHGSDAQEFMGHTLHFGWKRILLRPVPEVLCITAVMLSLACSTAHRAHTCRGHLAPDTWPGPAWQSMIPGSVQDSERLGK